MHGTIYIKSIFVYYCMLLKIEVHILEEKTNSLLSDDVT